MKYYRVIQKYGGMEVLKTSGRFLKISTALIGNELYTPAELRKLLNGATLRGCGDCEQIFEPVELKKSAVYTMFGARFECGKGYGA